MSKLNIVAEPGTQEISFSRVFDAPRELVFKMYTDPELIAQWWGPRRLTTKVDKLDAKSGGTWRLVHYEADGTSYGFHGVYHEVTAPVRVVQTFEFEGMPGHVSLETLYLEDLGGNKTKMTSTSVYQSVADRDGMLHSGMESGMTESMERFDELVKKA